jgi:hypothetical protein
MDERSNRRLDRILDPTFVDGLDVTSDDELRGRLRLSREAEEEVSYVRRLLHGKLDILRAELDARLGGRGTARGLEALSQALGSGTLGTHRGARAPVVTRVASSAGRRRAERIVSDAQLARLPDLDSPEIEAVITRAALEESHVSKERKRLHEVIDSLESELAGRYRAGLAPPV